MNIKPIKELVLLSLSDKISEWANKGFSMIDTHPKHGFFTVMDSLTKRCDCPGEGHPEHYEKGVVAGIFAGLALAKLERAGELEAILDDYKHRISTAKGENVKSFKAAKVDRL